MSRKSLIFAVMSVAIMSVATGTLHSQTSPGEIVSDTDFYDLDMVFDDLSRPYILINGDTIHVDFLPRPRSGLLTPLDYVEVAEELGVEVAAIKAVVEIETGRTHRGIVDSLTVINFDLPIFRQMAARRGISLARYTSSHPAVFARPNIRKYGSPLAAEHALLRDALAIDSLAAIQGTFWGMFQIGGFNWQLCGAESPAQFVELMGRSERDQLELFAEFLRNTGLLKHLKQKNWTAFAKGYNGPSYASHNYHNRLAAAYRKYSK